MHPRLPNWVIFVAFISILINLTTVSSLYLVITTIWWGPVVALAECKFLTMQFYKLHCKLLKPCLDFVFFSHYICSGARLFDVAEKNKQNSCISHTEGEQAVQEQLKSQTWFYSLPWNEYLISSRNWLPDHQQQWNDHSIPSQTLLWQVSCASQLKQRGDKPHTVQIMISLLM